MNVWIFVISAVFSPVLEPLGLDAPLPAASSAVAPSAVAPASVDLGSVDPGSIDPGSIDMDQMRYPGIERLLAELETNAG